MTQLKVALVHDWLNGMRGGEYVLEAVAEIFPKSDLFTLVYYPNKISPILTTLRPHTSYLQKLPSAERRYRHFLPLMPSAIERFDLRGYDLVISTSHCVAKGIRKAPGAVHLSYIFAPMRYMWDRFDEYFGPGKASLPVRLLARAMQPRLQDWDRRVSQPDRVDQIVVLSRFIQEEVKKFYGRDSHVIYPFADGSRFVKPRQPGRNYLMVGAFAPYKRVDLAIEAFNRLGLPLIVVGGGQDEKRLRKMGGSNIDFTGPLSNEVIAELYSKCRAFVFPGREDFGITPVEAMAAGAPVIAFGEGGALETVTEKTGVFFREQTVDSLCEAVMRIESGAVTFSEADCRARAADFTRAKFQQELVEVLRAAWAGRGKDPSRLEAKLAAGWWGQSIPSLKV